MLTVFCEIFLTVFSLVARGLQQVVLLRFLWNDLFVTKCYLFVCFCLQKDIYVCLGAFCFLEVI